MKRGANPAPPGTGAQGSAPGELVDSEDCRPENPGAAEGPCAAGRGGHASLLARDAGPSGTVILCDLDSGNLAFAAERVADGVNQTVLRQENWDRAGA